jgi:hypothetical protein
MTAISIGFLVVVCVALILIRIGIAGYRAGKASVTQVGTPIDLANSAAVQIDLSRFAKVDFVFKLNDDEPWLSGVAVMFINNKALRITSENPANVVVVGRTKEACV